MKKLIPVLALAALLPLPARAAVETYSFDKVHTQITFFVNHLGFSNSSGRFHVADGQIAFDRSNPEKSSVQVTIDATNPDMDDDKWNEAVKAADFLDSAHYPTMSFKSTAIHKLSGDTADIDGDLTVHGVTKPVTLHAIFNKAERETMIQAYVAGFSATAKIKRSDFGISKGIPFVADDMDIRIEVEAHRNDKPGQEPYNK